MPLFKSAGGYVVLLVLCVGLKSAASELDISGPLAEGDANAAALGLSSIDSGCGHLRRAVDALPAQPAEVSAPSSTKEVRDSLETRIFQVLLTRSLPPGSSAKRLKAIAAICADDTGEVVDHQGKRQLQADEAIDSSTYGGFVVLCGLVLFVLIVLWEAGWLGSSIVYANVQKIIVAAEKELQKDLQAVVDRINFWAADNGKNKNGRVLFSESDAPEMSPEDVKAFWRRCEEISKLTKEEVEPECKKDVVGFTQLDFPGLESQGYATIRIQRRGARKDVASVMIRTSENSHKGGLFDAVKGSDFVPIDIQVTFQPGEELREIKITLPETTGSWMPTRMFLVELYEVTAGNVRLGGPTVAHWRDGEALPTARVCIIEDDTFPPDAPRKILDGAHRHNLRLVWYYIKSRIRERGWKYWKTMLALMYTPVHTVVVLTIVQTMLVEWAARPSKGGSLSAIIGLLIWYAVSLAIWRWADDVQTKNRGRTGGQRQVARHQLLAKQLMMEHEEHYIYPGSAWFYAALNNVDVMVASGYWQSFVVVQNILAMTCCFLVLFWKAWYKSQGTGKDISPSTLQSLACVLVVPVPFVIARYRRRRTATLLEGRMDAEEGWVNTFAWLAQSGRRLYSMGYKELCHMEAHFSSQSKDFVKKHQTARDFQNDTIWITRWLGYTLHLLVMLWCGLYLLDEVDEVMTASDALIFMRIFDQFSRYLAKLARCFTEIEKGAVSTGRVARLLNIQECRSMLERLESPMGTSEFTRYIEMEGVEFTPPEHGSGLGPMSDLRFREEKIQVPIGKFVSVFAANESKCMSFLSLCAGISKPTKGTIRVPPDAWSVMLPDVPVENPYMTVSETLMLGGASRQVAENMARCLGLDPDSRHWKLTYGQSSMLVLATALLRDPEVLVCMRPLAHVHSAKRARIDLLLHVWQRAGGAQAIVQLLSGHNFSDEQALSARMRTVVLTSQRTALLNENYHIDLDMMLDQSLGDHANEWQKAIIETEVNGVAVKVVEAPEVVSSAEGRGEAADQTEPCDTLLLANKVPPIELEAGLRSRSESAATPLSPGSEFPLSSSKELRPDHVVTL
eukprot:TRINITY_DN111121_c0_g1_i1.p1 TRINITY_DN111121_c0_g1~~TRINITY_DN111121_c0_g1_i1.p1  ORF type:complete len:1076 (-),score=179.57 TRINITY_DN111121_c0_g1_i1:121-3348(-)